MQTEHTDLRGRAEPAQEPREERQSSGVLSQHQTATSAPSVSLELPSWEFCKRNETKEEVRRSSSLGAGRKTIPGAQDELWESPLIQQSLLWEGSEHQGTPAQLLCEQTGQQRNKSNLSFCSGSLPEPLSSLYLAGLAAAAPTLPRSDSSLMCTSLAHCLLQLCK